MSGQHKLALALYKGLLRQAHRMDALAIALPSEVRASLHVSSGAVSAAQVVRAAFRSGPAAAGSGASLDTALALLPMASKLVAARLSTPADDGVNCAVSPARAPITPRDDHAPLFTVGQVIRHRRLGYRGVIVGVDVACRAGEAWRASARVEELPHGAEQPFYRVLVDVRDRPAAQISYVGQDNLTTGGQAAEGCAPAAYAATMAPVLHPLMGAHFLAFKDGAYVLRLGDDGDDLNPASTPLRSIRH